MLRKMTLFRRKICLLHKYCIVSLSCSPSFKFVPSESHTLIIHARFKCNAKSFATPHKCSALRVLKFVLPALSRMQYHPATQLHHTSNYTHPLSSARVSSEIFSAISAFTSLSLFLSENPTTPASLVVNPFIYREPTALARASLLAESCTCVYICAGFYEQASRV